MTQFRGRISDKDDGYTPRSVVELSLRAGIGAILSKPLWWRKWLSEDGVIRERWLREVEEQYVRQTFYWSAKQWAPSNNWTTQWWLGCAFKKLKDFPVDAPDVTKRAFISEQCATMEYHANFDGGNEYRYTDDDSFQNDNEKLESFGQLLWYFSLLIKTRELKTQPLEQWPIQDVDDMALDCSPVVKEIQELLKGVRAARLDKSRFLEWCADADPRPQVVDALWFHIDRVMNELDDVRKCVITTLDLLIEAEGLTMTSVGDGFISPGSVNETWMGDFLIQSELKARFLTQVSVLENVPDEKKDWHPGSNNQVLDLVHPSLYCGVQKKTKRVPASVTAHSGEMTIMERMQRIAFKATKTVRVPDTFLWIPSDFAVDDNGHVKILSYINNLHPVQHEAMYDSIASIFERFVPLFNRVLSCLTNEHDGGCAIDVPDMSDTRCCDADYLPDRLPIPESFPLEPECSTPYTIKGTTVQVIVKIAEIHLTPEKPSYPGGSWHIEGTDAEQIVATGLYYFGCENITESKLSFRVIVQEPEYAQSDSLGMAAMYGLERDELLVQSLGAATAIEDRCLVFPNTLQHKVEPFELADKSKPGVRKILAFFLVDPSKTIPSTSVIPPQQKEWQEDLLRNMVKETNLPVDAMKEQLTGMLVDGMTWDEAIKHREDLMDNRRVDQTWLIEDEELLFSLCEH